MLLLYNDRFKVIPFILYLLCMWIFQGSHCQYFTATMFDFFKRPNPTTTITQALTDLSGPNVCERPKEVFVPYTVTEEVKPHCDTLDKMWAYVSNNHKCDSKHVTTTKYRTKEVTEKVCCLGYIPFQNKCIPFCPDTCTHGICVAPNECQCDAGFSGKRCLYACKNMTWGASCNQRCDCKNADSCDPENGQCDCKPGWTGKDCSKACTLGTWGKNCSQMCHCTVSEQLANSENSCNRFDGLCDQLLPSNCAHKPGFRGPNCDIRCPPLTFGPNCQSKCRPECETVWNTYNSSSLLNNQALAASAHMITKRQRELCNPVNGHCFCPPGLYGDHCQEICDFGKYGLDCELSCECSNLLAVIHKGPSLTVHPNENNNDENTGNGETYLSGGDNTCDPVSGTCRCADGYFGIICQNRVCPARKFSSAKTLSAKHDSGNNINFLISAALAHPSSTQPSTNTNNNNDNGKLVCDTSCDCPFNLDLNNNLINSIYPRFQDCHPLTGDCRCGSGWTNPPTCDLRCPLVNYAPDSYYRSSAGVSCSKRCHCGPNSLQFHKHLSPPNQQNNNNYNVPNKNWKVFNSYLLNLSTNTFDASLYGPLVFECHPLTGDCLCPPGFKGPSCDETCPPTKFGPNCQHECSHCPTKVCHPISGKCPELTARRCSLTSTDPNCDRPCRGNTWGPKCEKKCHCANNATCEPITGKCICLPGYIGTRCTDKCPPGRYGPQCAHDCQAQEKCLALYSYSEQLCNHVTGACTCNHTLLNAKSRLSSTKPTNLTNMDDVFNDQVICGIGKNFPYSYANALGSRSMDKLQRSRWIWFIVSALLAFVVIALLLALFLRRKKLIPGFRFMNGNKSLDKRLYDSYHVTDPEMEKNFYEMDNTVYGLPKSTIGLHPMTNNYASTAAPAINPRNEATFSHSPPEPDIHNIYSQPSSSNISSTHQSTNGPLLPLKGVSSLTSSNNSLLEDGGSPPIQSTTLVRNDLNIPSLNTNKTSIQPKKVTNIEIARKLANQSSEQPTCSNEKANCSNHVNENFEHDGPTTLSSNSRVNTNNYNNYESQEDPYYLAFATNKDFNGPRND